MVTNLAHLIGETTDYDKKQQLEINRPKSWCKSVSAFANGRGGSLIFGVADDDTVIGLETTTRSRKIQRDCQVETGSCTGVLAFLREN